MKQPVHRTKKLSNLLYIPELPAPKTPEQMVAYVTEFNRLNGLKPLPFTFRGRTYC